jgi:hypothetical protein
MPSFYSRYCDHDKELPLFEAAEQNRVRRLPLAARRLARRLNLPAATARTVAELAGFAVEAH